MSQADELLNSLSSDEIAVYSANPETEEHIIIDNNRFISVPESLKRIAVQYDHDIETVTFDCPRYWDGIDMSGMKIYINYMLTNRTKGMYLAKNISIDETDSNIMHFDWTISNNVTLVKGQIAFLVCIKKTDEEGNEENHWNSELNTEMYVSEGLECTEAIISMHPDIITDLLTRMDYVETIATPENMQSYVSDYLNNDPILQQNIEDQIYEYLVNNANTSYEAMQSYIDRYLTEHPPLFVIGPNKPGVKCLWFNTGDGSGTTENLTLKVASESTNDSVYAEVEDVADPVYNFDVI